MTTLADEAVEDTSDLFAETRIGLMSRLSTNLNLPIRSDIDQQRSEEIE